MRELTAEDMERIRAEARAVRDRAMGLDVEVPEVRSRRVGTSRKGVSSTRVPMYPRDKIRAMHEAGMSSVDIARQLGAHRGSIHRILRDMDIVPNNGRSGPRRKDVCSRGHSMDEHGRELPKGGRQCMECRRITNREWAKKKYKEARHG